MKEVVILALKDRDGIFYACNAFIDNQRPGLTTRLYYEHPVEAPAVEIFPYSNFSSFSSYDQNLYEFTYLHALVELSDNEFETLNAGDIKKSKFHKRKVQAIKELKTPFAYTLDFVRKHLEKEEYNNASNIRYGALVWQYMLGFNSEEEFETYLKLRDTIISADRVIYDYKFSPTRFNKDYLEKILLLKNIRVDMYNGCGDEVFGINKEELIKNVDKYPLVAFANFHQNAFMDFLPLADQERVNKLLFDTVINLTGEKIQEYIPYMTKKVILEYGADYLLEQAFPEMYFMLKEAEYEAEETFEYEYDEMYSSTYDARDSEMEMIDKILPYVTEKSLPLIEKLVYEKIESYLPEYIKSKLC